ncbi:hypothetical protein BJX62DRAFT_97170 [Aspergillus germanicus]
MCRFLCIQAGARLEFISPEASFPPLPSFNGTRGLSSLALACRKNDRDHSVRTRSEAAPTACNQGYPCCMTSAGQNAGSSSDFLINPPLSGRANRPTRICRVPRTNWRVHGSESMQGYSSICVSLVRVRPLCSVMMIATYCSHHCPVSNVEPFRLPLRLSAMNTRAHPQVSGDFHLGTITDDLYVILPCLFPLVIVSGRDSRPADANKRSNSDPTNNAKCWLMTRCQQNRE